MLKSLYARYKTRTAEQKQLLSHTLLATVFKVLSAGMAFLLNIVAARLLGTEQSGLFFLGWSLTILLGMLCLLGMDNALLRFIGKLDSQTNNPLINQIFTRAYMLALPTSLVVAMMVYFFTPFLAIYVFEKPELENILRYFAFSIPFVSMFLLNGYAFQARRKIIASLCSMQLGICALMIAGLYGLFWFNFFLNAHYDIHPPHILQANNAALLFLVSTFIVAIFGLTLWLKPKNRRFDTHKPDLPELWRSAPNFWLISAAGQGIPWICVVIVGLFVSSENVAFFSAALRTSLLISFMLTVVNFVVAPRFSAYWEANRLSELKKLAQYSCRFMLIVSSPVLLIVFIWPSQIMSLFGDAFSQAAMVLLILCIGQTVNLLTGSVGFLLSMCGHEREMRNLTVFSGLITLFLVVTFTLLWGIIGAAIAISFGTITQNLIAIYNVKSKLGFWPV